MKTTTNDHPIREKHDTYGHMHHSLNANISFHRTLFKHLDFTRYTCEWMILQGYTCNEHSTRTKTKQMQDVALQGKKRKTKGIDLL